MKRTRSATEDGCSPNEEAAKEEQQVETKRSRVEEGASKAPDEENLSVAQLLEPAQKGEAQAQYLLARCFAKGKGGVERSRHEALGWYLAAAQQEHPMAQYKLGRCLCRGQGVKKNDREGFQWMLKAAQNQVHKAQSRVGYSYDYGRGVAQDQREAVRWYRAAAEGGNARAQNNLAVCLGKGEGVDKVDPEEAFRWYLAAAKQGLAHAQYNVAVCYEQGDGVEVNWETAVGWYRAAMEKGHPKAKYELAKCLYKARGVEGDPEKALQYLKEVAKKHDFGPAMYKLARYLEKIAMHSKEASILESAAKWYCQALQKGVARAKCRLGLLDVDYRSNSGQQAVMRYLQSKREDASAQFNLALALCTGKGFDSCNQDAADKWFLEAAKQHHARAQYFVARRLAEQGKDEEALGWFLASARQGFAKAQYQAGIRLVGVWKKGNKVKMEQAEEANKIGDKKQEDEEENREEEKQNEQEEQEQHGMELCNQAAKSGYLPALLWLAKYWRARGQFTKGRKYLALLLTEPPRTLTTSTRLSPYEFRVRHQGRTLVKEMDRNKEGLPVKSLVERCSNALVDHLEFTWHEEVRRMKEAMPAELWQGWMEPQLPDLVHKVGKSKKKEEDSEDEEEDSDEDDVADEKHQSIAEEARCEAEDG
ncbi:3-carboxymuconate cyclase [Balamuthia mandrillaris]